MGKTLYLKKNLKTGYEQIDPATSNFLSDLDTNRARQVANKHVCHGC
jgi:hypothetical protein